MSHAIEIDVFGAAFGRLAVDFYHERINVLGEVEHQIPNQGVSFLVITNKVCIRLGTRWYP